MKRILFIACLFGMLSACHKEAPYSKNKSGDDAKDDSYVGAGRGEKDCAEGITVTSGMLQFEDFDHFWNTYLCLTEEYETGVNDFFEPFGFDSTQEDLANDTAVALEFEPFSCLKEFEDQFSGFTSLRSYLSASEVYWMESQDMNPSHDPFKLITLPRVMRSMFNSEKKVMIGDSVFTDDMVEGHSRAYGDCWQWNATQDFNTYTTGKKYKRRTGIHFWGVATTLFAETESFKKKANGQWKWFFTGIGTAPFGGVHNSTCGDEPNISVSEQWRTLPWGSYVSKNRSFSYKCKAREGVSEYKSKHKCGSSQTTHNF